MNSETPMHAKIHYQRGAVSLVIALLLLFGMTLIAFFANRSFIFEQRTSANQYRSTKAFEMAEAGLEWALGKLNESMPLTAAPSCVPLTSGTNASFRARFINPSAADATHSTGWMNVNTAAFPGCRIDAAGNATCACPTAGQADLGTLNPEQPRFGVRFNAVAGDATAVEIISRGCTNGNSCDPTATDVPTSDATAVVRVIVKIVPSLPAGPAAALTTGSAAVAGGNLNVINTHAPSNGITIHAGTTVATGSGANVTTLPGTPPRASVLDADPTLANLTAAGEDQFFSAFFGQTLTYYRDYDPGVIHISGCSAADCGQQIMNAIATGLQNPRFFVDGDVTFNNGNLGGATIGSAANPVTIVSNGNMEMRSNLTAYGVFYAATASATENWDFDGSGTATIFGAFISRGNFDKGSGTLNLVYDPSLWGGTAAPTGRLVRVPGSWRDKSSDY
jgi:Tfp pilus assembly protein PilX